MKAQHVHRTRSSGPVPRVVPLLWLVVLLACTAANGFLFGSGHDALAPVRNALHERKQQLDELSAWNEGNVTGMGNWSFHYDPDSLQPVLAQLPSDVTRPDGAAYYHNLTGFYKGHWAGWDFSSPESRRTSVEAVLNVSSAGSPRAWDESLIPSANSSLVDDRGTFDWLAAPREEAAVSFNFNQEHVLPGSVAMIRGSLELEAPSSSKRKTKSVDYDLVGLHFLQTGSLYLLAVAEEVDAVTDVRNVLAMVPKHERSINLTVSALEKDFQARIQRLQGIIDSGSYDPGGDAESVRNASHNCTLHIYGKLKSAGREQDISLLEALETELEHPTGISTIPAAPLAMTLRIFSPECQVLLTSEHIDGLTKARLWKKAVNYAAIYFVVLLVQTRLLVQQMDVTRTPSGLAKVSDRTFGLQSMLDAYVGLAHLSVGIALDNEATVPLLACAFMSLMLFLAFGYRYALTIYRTQAPETADPSPAPAATNPSNEGAGAETTAIGQPPTAPAPVPAAANSPEQLDTRRRTRFIVGFAVLLAMSGFFPLLLAKILLPLLYSFWIPQIRRNVQRGTRRAIQTKCIVGLTICRLVLPLYLFACPSNVLFTQPTRWIYLLVAYVVLQAVVLLLQDLLGPHFFIPPSRRPASAHEQWNWHPPIEALKPVQTSNVGGGPNGEDARWSLGDCAICLNQIVPGDMRRRRSGTTTPRRERARKRGKSGQVYSAVGTEDSIAEDEDEGDEDTLSDLEGGPSHLYPPEKGAASTSGARARSKGRPIRPSGRIFARRRSWRSWLANAIHNVAARIGENPLRRRRTEVMVAPCNHIFHTACLERWLMIKTECPSCRRPLPPV